MCVCLSVCVCLSPSHAIFFEASDWSSDHMTRSRPLIGQPSFPTIWWWWWWCGAARCGAVRRGAVLRGAARFGAVGCGVVRCGTVRCSAGVCVEKEKKINK